MIDYGFSSCKFEPIYPVRAILKPLKVDIVRYSPKRVFLAFLGPEMAF